MLYKGRSYIDTIMKQHGFVWEQMASGNSSGGNFDSGRYVNGNRSLELHFRFSLGLVTYHMGDISISHEDYMRHIAPRGAAEYPGFSDEPLSAFSHLANDLSKYASDFLSGTGDDLIAAKASSVKMEKRSGFQRLSST